VTAEGWAQVPAGVVHALEPAGRLRMLNIHAPALGYAAFIERLARATGPEEVYRAREGFDQHDPPEDGGSPGPAVAAQLGGDEGETITDRPGRRVTLLGDTAEIGVTESVYGPGERGPAPHIHRDHADAFVVLEGALTFTLRGTTLHVPAGTLVVVPPLVVHSFGNEGEVPARFVNLHAPSCGFGEYLRGRNPGFDQHEAALGTGGDPASVVVTRLDTDTEGG
jgi:mannose-6-phosphate isomerase-like protein (cupin superfamily)